MDEKVFAVVESQAILHVREHICTSVRDLLQSAVFVDIVTRYYRRLLQRESPLLIPFRKLPEEPIGPEKTVDLLRVLSGLPIEQVAGMLPWAAHFTERGNRRRLHEFVEGLYDFWRNFDRYMILHSEPGPSSFDQRPYRAFNATLENLTHIVRALYRDICENVTGDRPRVYRQVAAGCDAGVIAVPRNVDMPGPLQEVLGAIPFVRQIMIDPPLLIDPPMNRRTGRFEKIGENPLAGLELETNEYLCYPVLVGPLTIFVYVHQLFAGLGCSLANLFELADDETLGKGPDAVYLFGAPPPALEKYGELPTVFRDTGELLVAAVPAEPRFGYFGYLKKMILTLHNVIMMQRGRMPFHGAMVRVLLKGDRSATFLIIGDTAAGKSESLEALRLTSGEGLEEMRIIADDMGSIGIDENGRLLGYGTEIGAFVRLDDLQQGYAFEQIDRAIFMSPQKVNARVVLPVTTLADVLAGQPLDYILYANNYEQVDEDHPVVQRFASAGEALATFREGAAMAKGTTTASGLVHSYFANIFGPPQYRELHEPLARKTFEAAFAGGTFVGQLRTRLGVEGFSTEGPQAAARALLELVDAGGVPERQ